MKNSVTIVRDSPPDAPEGSQADRMLRYAEDEDHYEIRLFRDQRNTPHIQIYDSDTEIAQIHRIKSNYVRLWLHGLLWKREKKAPSGDSVRSALNVLMARAQDQPVISLYNRVARLENSIYLDMCDDYWRAIKITKDGWTITSAPIVFRRYSHQKPLPEPKRGGSITPRARTGVNLNSIFLSTI